ncbi:MAG: glycosyltransferase, partial [Blastocatellia bacterium]
MEQIEVSACALVPYPLNTAPSQRYRIEQWLPHLREQSVKLDIIPFADPRLMSLLHKPGRLIAKAALLSGAFLRRFREISRARQFDVVVVHRAACIAGPALVERAIAMTGTPVVFDFDDAIYLEHTTHANRHFGFLKFPGKTAAICQISKGVVVGNSHLADYARQYNDRVTVVPTSVDTSLYQPRPRPSANGKVVIGWMGSSTSQTHLELFSDRFAKLSARKDVELRVISDREPVLPGVKFQWRAWSAGTEVEELSGFDIGIMPLPDDQWARGKCALKALTYM